MRIIWIDDDWTTNEKSSLDALRIEIENTLEKEDVDILWEIFTDPVKAYKNIDQNSTNYLFAIVDIDFGDDNNATQFTAANDLIYKLKEKKIHYVVYSNLVGKMKNNNSYCIGLYKKGVDRREQLIDVIKNFFTCPPFRILQISDIHYNTNVNTRDRNNLLASLEKKINEIHLEKKIDIIMIAGDLVASKPAEELSLIEDRLKNIFKILKMKEDRIFLVPGNHEVIWKDYLNKEVASSSYSGYVSLCRAMFSRSVLCSMRAWNKNTLPLSVTEDGLTWHRTLHKPQVSIIGICSNSASSNMQGLGYLSESNIDYINDIWGKQKKINELRIFLLHHNLFPVQSFNSKDENRTVINAGTALNSLVHNNCDIVLSGHTHRPEVILYQTASLSSEGYNYNKSLLLVASGTSGGNTSTSDFAKNFNIIDISKNLTDEKRHIAITPYMFDSRIISWDSKDITEYCL